MFEELLSPISDEQPCGEYLKDNRTLFRGYRNAFNLAQSSFRQLVETPDALDDAEAVNTNIHNWDKLSDECFSCLQTVSKDVEIFSWFTVAQLFSNQPFQRLADALSVFEQVVEQHWDNLQPTLPEAKRKGSSDEEQAREVAEHRVKPLLQLVGDTAESGLLYMPLQMLPLVGDIDYGVFYKAEKGGTLVQLKEQAVAQFSQERGEVEARIIALGSAFDALIKLEKALSDKCFSVGAQVISFRFAKETIERLLKALEYLTGDQFSRWPLAPEEPEAVTETVAAEASANAPEEGVTQASSAAQMAQSTGTAPAQVAAFNTSAVVANREQALAQLQHIANYFLETEPHSPIYLLLKRAVRWGGMSLPELLQELVGDNNSVHQRIEQLAGLESAEHQAKLSMSVTASAPVTQFAAPMAEPIAEPAAPQISLPVEETRETKQSSNDGDDSSSGGLSSIEW